MIALELVSRLRLAQAPIERCFNTADLLLAALFHDAAESRSGDIPTPAKASMGIEEPVGLCPWLKDCDPYSSLPGSLKTTLDLADKIEAYTFIARYGSGSHGMKAADYMHRKIQEVCPDGWRETVDGLITDICIDRER